MLLLTLGTLVLVERAATGFRPLQPRSARSTSRTSGATSASGSSTTTSFFDMFNGTPLKGLIWRLLGVRIGRRVFDDGCSIPEKSLVTVGDDCMLNAGSALVVPLAGGRDVQVRPHHRRRRLHARASGRSRCTA